MKALLVLLILFISTVVFANGSRFSELDHKIVQHLFNGEYATATSLIEEQIKANPQNPKYYYLRTYSDLYARYFAPNNMDRDSLELKVVEHGQKALDVANEMEETTEIKFYKGQVHSYISRSYIFQQDYWEAYFAARKGRNYLEEVVEEDPSFYDAYLEPGILEYFTATRVDGWRGTLAWFVGMSGDREKGLKNIAMAAEKGDLHKTEARFVSAMMHRFFEPDAEQAYDVLRNLAQEYPGNNFIQNQYRNLEFNRLIEENGADYVVANIDSLQAEYINNNANVLNVAGYNFIANEDYDNAIKIFRLNIQLFPEVANCYDSYAECNLLMGNNEEAAKYYKIAYEKLDADETINDNFRETLRESIEGHLKELNAL